MSGPGIGYALARAHARHAARPSEVDWRRLDGARTASQYLQQVRQTGLNRWVRAIGDEDDQASVELKLRAAFRAHADEVAGWLPATARPATRLIGELADLPALDHLHRGGTPQAWMADDPALADAFQSTPTQPPFEAWMARWRALDRAAKRARATEWLGTLLRDLVRPGRAASAAARLHWIFRNRMLDASGVHAYLGLVLDDLRRLAGGMARRRPGESRHLEAT